MRSWARWWRLTDEDWCKRGATERCSAVQQQVAVMAGLVLYPAYHIFLASVRCVLSFTYRTFGCFLECCTGSLWPFVRLFSPVFDLLWGLIPVVGQANRLKVCKSINQSLDRDYLSFEPCPNRFCCNIEHAVPREKLDARGLLN